MVIYNLSAFHHTKMGICEKRG